MKVSAFIPLILSSTALAASRRSHNAVTARQAQIKRGLVDVCVALDLDVKLLDILPGGKPLVAGHVELCLCVSVLPDFIRTNSVGQNVVHYLGEARGQDFFRDLINSQSNKQQCHYPDHCEPICDWDRPCHFTCKDGFVPDNEQNPTKCICPLPNTVCNGKCGDFPNGCASQVPQKRSPTCSPGRTLCGVPGGSKGKAYDCIDIKTNVESCGGCLVKNPFGVETPVGKDCLAIPNVDRDHVKCISSSCHVSACKNDYVPSKDHDSCVRKEGKRDEWDDFLNLAVAEGLIAKVADLVWIKELLLANVHVGRGLHDTPELDRGIILLLEKGIFIGVHTLLEVKARLGLLVHVGRDLHDSPELDRGILVLLEEGALVGVHTLLEVKEALGLVAHIGRRDEWDDLLNLCVKEGLIAKVADLVWIKELLLANVHVGRGLHDTPELDRGILLLLEKNILIGVHTLLEVKAKLGLLVHVARHDQWDDLLDALVVQGLIANIADLVGIREGLLAGLHIA